MNAWWRQWPPEKLTEGLVYQSRYRHAAVHGKGGNNSTDSTRPRSGTQEAFVGTEILEGRADFQLLINEWSVYSQYTSSVYSQYTCSILPILLHVYPYRCESPSQEWVLLYRGSRDGFHGRNFHSCCDDKGATVVITKVPTQPLATGMHGFPPPPQPQNGRCYI